MNASFSCLSGARLHGFMTGGCFLLLLFCFVFRDRFSLCNSPSCPSSCRPGWPRTHRDSAATAYRVLGLKACATTTRPMGGCFPYQNSSFPRGVGGAPVLNWKATSHRPCLGGPSSFSLFQGSRQHPESTEADLGPWMRAQESGGSHA